MKVTLYWLIFFFFSSRRRHTRLQGDWSSDVCSSDLLFPPNTHDQIAITALAMEKAKSPMAVDWSKQIIPVGNGPGQEVDDVVEALKLVRAGKAINFQGAGSTCDFTPNGDQLGRGMGQWIIRNGKSQFVEYAKP